MKSQFAAHASTNYKRITRHDLIITVEIFAPKDVLDTTTGEIHVDNIWMATFVFVSKISLHDSIENGIRHYYLSF